MRRYDWRAKPTVRDVHVLPIGDLKRHLDKRACWCDPEITRQTTGRRGALVVHQSMDGRELVERYGLQ